MHLIDTDSRTGDFLVAEARKEGADGHAPTHVTEMFSRTKTLRVNSFSSFNNSKQVLFFIIHISQIGTLTPRNLTCLRPRSAYSESDFKSKFVLLILMKPCSAPEG